MPLIVAAAAVAGAAVAAFAAAAGVLLAALDEQPEATPRLPTPRLPSPISPTKRRRVMFVSTDILPCVERHAGYPPAYLW